MTATSNQRGYRRRAILLELQRGTHSTAAQCALDFKSRLSVLSENPQVGLKRMRGNSEPIHFSKSLNCLYHCSHIFKKSEKSLARLKFGLAPLLFFMQGSECQNWKLSVCGPLSAPDSRLTPVWKAKRGFMHVARVLETRVGCLSAAMRVSLQRSTLGSLFQSSQVKTRRLR